MKVANPRLTLYAFHLRNNLAQGEEQPVDDANHLWEQCQQLGEKLNVPRLKFLLERLQDSHGKIGITPSLDNPESDYLELLQSERWLSFSAIPNGSSLQLRGEVYPLQIHDTYAVDITLRYPYPHIEIDQLAGLSSHSASCRSDSVVDAKMVKSHSLTSSANSSKKNPTKHLLGQKPIAIAKAVRMHLMVETLHATSLQHPG